MPIRDRRTADGPSIQSAIVSSNGWNCADEIGARGPVRITKWRLIKTTLHKRDCVWIAEVTDLTRACRYNVGMCITRKKEDTSEH